MSRNLEDYQSKYSTQPYEKQQSEFRCRVVKKILARYLDATILEVGCGLESIFLHLDSFAEIIVTEPSEVFFTKAQQDAKKLADKNITVINASLEDATKELENRRFDFILVSALLHEVSDRGNFLAAVCSLCHAETTVHINVPNANSFHRLLAVDMGLIKNAHELSPANIEFQQSTVFDMESLQQTVEAAGLAVQESGAYMLKPFTHMQMQKMIDSEILTPELLEGLYAMGKRLPSLCSEIYINAKIKNA